MMGQSRSQIYLLLVGVVTGMLIAGVAVPLGFGQSLTTTTTTGDVEVAGPSTPGIGDDESADHDRGVGAEGSVRADSGSGAASESSGVSGVTSTSSSARGPAGPGPAGRGRGDGDGGGGRGAGLAATDRGVSAETIKLGFFVLDFGTVGRLGIAVDVDPEQQQAAYQAFVDDMNARGGIHGRMIEPHFRAYDVTNRNDQIAACREMTQDREVFATLGGFNLPDGTLCVVEENQTPLVAFHNNNPDWLFDRAAGRLFTTYQASGRMMETAVAELTRLGLADKKFGILSDDMNDPGAPVAKTLQRNLEGRGTKVVYRGQLSGDLSVAQSQIPVEVNKARTADGTGAEVIVLLVNNGINGTNFVNQADSQSYHPVWTNTDWALGGDDTTSQNMPRSYEGAYAFTNNVGLGNKQPPAAEPSVAAECKRRYEQHSGRKLKPMGETEYGITMSFCDTLRIFDAAATNAGPQLTRASLSAAAQQLGAFPLAGYGGGRYGRGKFDYSDLIRTTRWEWDCKCWGRRGGFHRPGGR